MKNKTPVFPIKWRCLVFDRIINVSREGVYNLRYGWLCCCGEFIKENNSTHEIILWGVNNEFF